MHAPSSPARLTGRLAGALALAFCCLALAGAPDARAGLLVNGPDSCSGAGAAQTFSPWHDLAHYVVAPGGRFEGADTRWKLSGAAVVDGNEPWRVRGSADARSLAIEPGGVVTSPPLCVELSRPVMRFFARGKGLMAVSVVLKTKLGLVLEVPVGAVLGTRRWAPTPPFLVVANSLALVRGPVSVRLRLRPVGAHSAFVVDDVHLDPYAKR